MKPSCLTAHSDACPEGTAGRKGAKFLNDSGQNVSPLAKQLSARLPELIQDEMRFQCIWLDVHDPWTKVELKDQLNYTIREI